MMNFGACRIPDGRILAGLAEPWRILLSHVPTGLMLKPVMRSRKLKDDAAGDATSDFEPGPMPDQPKRMHFSPVAVQSIRRSTKEGNNMRLRFEYLALSAVLVFGLAGCGGGGPNPPKHK